MKTTDWFPYSTRPVRVGMYECRVQYEHNGPIFRTMVFWNGVWFQTGVPMLILEWRGLAERPDYADAAG